ncbi:hypothetical protein AX15_007863 [Amanita polypyramis BW_CC]|nr:hypothetical protein AX15_007863 [Amanita polypyramis BW_CC]
MVKRKRTDNYEALISNGLPEVGPDASVAAAPQDDSGVEGPSGTNTEMMPPVVGGTRRSARQVARKAKSSLNEPSHSSPSASVRKINTTRRKQRLPGSTAIDNSSPEGQRALQVSSSLVEGPTPQPPTKKARLNIPAATADAEQSAFVAQTGSPKIDIFQPMVYVSPPLAKAGPSTTNSMVASQTQEIPDSESIPAKTKGKGKMKQKAVAPEEKRAARFKVQCPRNIMDRVQRVWQQRLFMIDRSRSDKELRESFNVLGSTGNVYTVVIDQQPRCNCPDANKGNHCKHILFIFLKVLRVPESSSLWYQKALLSSELEEIFGQAPLAPNCVAHQQVREALARSKGQEPVLGSSSSQTLKKRLPTEDDNCPICYETMYEVPENALYFCDVCGNALHNECWKQCESYYATILILSESLLHVYGVVQKQVQLEHPAHGLASYKRHKHLPPSRKEVGQ